MKIESDKPIDNKEQDKLKRNRFACNIAKNITNYSCKESLTIGLMGDWGCGKSSIINMMKNKISELKPDMVIVEFNPWYFSGRKQLISDFFQVLSSKVSGIGKDNMEKLGNSLELYSKLLKPLSLIPQIGSMFELMAKLTKETGDFAKQYAEDNKKIYKLKEEINDFLNDYEGKILVIIDEIDRLENQEIKEIFQLVRAVGDFNNIIYLLSFDKKRVYDVFGDYNDYLDKIINVPINVPQLSNSDINNYFLLNLESIFVERNIDKKYWNNVYKLVFENRFKNLREVNRFLNVIRFSYDDIMKDLNIVDYLFIKFLELFDKRFYNWIIKNKDSLLKSNKVGINNREIISDKWINTQDILEYIFKKDNHLKKCAISDDKYFDSYFQYSLQNGVLAFDELKEYSELKKKEDLERYIINFSKDELFTLFDNLNNISDYLDNDQKYFFNEVLINKIVTLDKTNTFIEKSQQCIAFTNLSNMVLTLNEEDVNSVNLLKELKFDERYDLTSLLRYLYDITKYFKDNRLKANLLPRLYRYINKLDYDAKLFSNFDILEKLGFSVEDYLKDLLSSDEGVIKYLESVQVTVEYGQNPIYGYEDEIVDVEEYEIKEIILENITDYIDYDLVKKRVENLSKEVKKSNEGIIRQFKNPMTREEFMKDENNIYEFEY